MQRCKAVSEPSRICDIRGVGRETMKHVPSKRVKAAYREYKRAGGKWSLKEFAPTHDDGAAWRENKRKNR